MTFSPSGWWFSNVSPAISANFLVFARGLRFRSFITTRICRWLGFDPLRTSGSDRSAITRIGIHPLPPGFEQLDHGLSLFDGQSVEARHTGHALDEGVQGLVFWVVYSVQRVKFIPELTDEALLAASNSPRAPTETAQMPQHLAAAAVIERLSAIDAHDSMEHGAVDAVVHSQRFFGQVDLGEIDKTRVFVHGIKTSGSRVVSCTWGPYPSQSSPTDFPEEAIL